MKYLFIILITTVFSISANSQTCCKAKHCEAASNCKPLDLGSLKNMEIKTIKLDNYTLNLKSSKRFVLFNDSANNKLILYDKIRKEYWQNDPLKPYGTVENTLIIGSVNYLLLLFDTK